MTNIHKTAIVDKKAELADDVKVGAYAIIEGQVRIGAGTSVGVHCYLTGDTEIGADNLIFPYAVVGTPPQDVKFEPGGVSRLRVGNGNRIREFCTLNCSTLEDSATTVGDDCWLLAYTHIAHDCVVGDRVKIANATNLAGHVEIESDAVLSGLIGVHQFVRVGCMAMIGGLSRVAVDVPPFLMAAPKGDDFRMCGLNLVGLKRAGYDKQRIRKIKDVYDVVYHAKLTVKEAVERIKQEGPDDEDVDCIAAFLGKAERGIVR